MELAPPCASCYREAFAALGRPHYGKYEKDDTAFYHRKMVVPRTCTRCDQTCPLLCTPEVTVRNIVLPASLIAQVAVIDGLHDAHILGGTKGQNHRLQTVHNLKLVYTDDPQLQFAVRTVGLAAVFDEKKCDTYSVPFLQRLLCATDADIAHIGWCTPVRGTPWRPLKTEFTSEEIIVQQADTITGDAGIYPPPPGDAEGIYPSPPSVTLPGTVDALEEEVQRERCLAHIAALREQAAEYHKAQVEQADRDHAVERTAAGEQLVAETVPPPAEITRSSITDTTLLPDFDIDLLPMPDTERTARQVFPYVGSKKLELHSNTVENLKAAERMRNQGVGNDGRSLDEIEFDDDITNFVIQHMFTEKNIKKWDREITRTEEALPKKLSEQEKHGKVHGFLDGYFDEGKVKAFIKSEVTDKPKPRIISDHGAIRQVALARIAMIYEGVLKDTAGLATIKGRGKKRALAELLTQASEVKRSIPTPKSRARDEPRGAWYENDLSAFDFGISYHMKKQETKILRHIIAKTGIEVDIDRELLWRVVDERNKVTTWIFSYKDESGDRCMMKLQLDHVIRDSGDRLTSSGNWYQNFLAWVGFFVKRDKIKAFIQRFVSDTVRGGTVEYDSAHSPGKHKMRMCLEGDDSLIFSSEIFSVEVLTAWFTLRGWKAKVKVLRSDESGALAFVGYEFLIENGRAVIFEGELVACPQVQRCLLTKAMNTCKLPDEDYHRAMALTAVHYTHEYERFPAMHGIWVAAYEHHNSKASTSAITAKTTMSYYRDLAMRSTSYSVAVDDDEIRQVIQQKPYPLLSNSDDAWRRMTEYTCGKASDPEWALFSSVTNIDMHGHDLAVNIPYSWRT
jgi:hypothetical protein